MARLFMYWSYLLVYLFVCRFILIYYFFISILFLNALAESGALKNCTVKPENSVN